MGYYPEPSNVTLKSLEMSEIVSAADRYDDAHYLLNLNNDNKTQAQTVYDEFTINYILREEDDYEVFVQEWLDNGGQALLDEAEEQFRSYGLID